MPEDEPRDPGYQLSQEHQGQEHGILQETHTHGAFETSAALQDSQLCSSTDQFEHPRAAAARGEAAKQAKDDDGGPGPDENIWRIGAILRRQREIGLQTHLPPHADSQQDHACELKITEWEM